MDSINKIVARRFPISNSKGRAADVVLEKVPLALIFNNVPSQLVCKLNSCFLDQNAEQWMWAIFSVIPMFFLCGALTLSLPKSHLQLILKDHNKKTFLSCTSLCYVQHTHC